MKLNCSFAYLAFICAFSCGLYVCPAQAEYRVFELVITDQTTNQSRSLLSTLDPWQYRDYYYVQPTEVITYSDTWKCWERGDEFKPLCPNPKAQAPAQPDSSPSAQP